MKKQKLIFVICAVRNADQNTREKLEAHKRYWENRGYRVHLPHLDTNQEASGYDICMQNMQMILLADEIHIFFDPSSKGSHFDLGVTFLACHLNPQKIIKVIENLEELEKDGQIKMMLFKSFGQMIEEWESRQSISV